MATTELNLDELKSHIGRRVVATDVITETPANLLRLTFGRSDPEFHAGDPLHVAVVARICEQVHVRGRSCCSVAKELTDAGIPSPSGVDWPSMSVRFIAYNPAYVGLLAGALSYSRASEVTSHGVPTLVASANTTVISGRNMKGSADGRSG